MHNPDFAPEVIIAALGSTAPAQREAALRALFDNEGLRRLCSAHVRKHGGNRQDGEDVFQEALIVLDRKLRLGDYRGEGSIEAYFMGIVRWHWYNEQQKTGRNNTRYMETPPEPPPNGDPELAFLLDERRDHLEKLLEQMASKCRNLLKLYQLDYSMEEIANQMGYASGAVAKKEAFLCRKRFKALLEKWFVGEMER